ncbi:Hsp33 family molecular chaperone HslO [Bordetella sp. 02P26C-1]|uniref:Hsp33 family molecular chaperone HslO n=1 Tax=Bordetella sp. 02P26C-1 TaxID=2683195 RepID=UPI0013539DBB|nr:Hsp33 family molecular chaperone HslO [Bordetella sp. 02P26C-1]MVW77844.1 Hsp33 family molecular chaperone HslO [Bordetella sp. 02P26C-1]
MTDQLKKFLFEDRSVRVQAVRLHETWLHAQEHHDYPPAIQRLLGELMAAAALLAANIKFEGSLVLQIQGTGPVALLVVECQSDLGMRATVKIREGQEVPPDGTMQSLLNTNNEGRFIVVLDPRRKVPGQQAYQGIVPLEGDTVAEALQHYMKASEQLDTRLWLQADGQHAAGLLIQRLPDHGGTAASESGANTLEHAIVMAETIKPDELLNSDIDTIIHRLYWEDTMIGFEPSQVRWHCPCTRERVGNMLRTLGEQEVNEILAEQGSVQITCDFCGKPYAFDPVDCSGLFTDSRPMPEQDPPTVH